MNNQLFTEFYTFCQANDEWTTDNINCMPIPTGSPSNIESKGMLKPFIIMAYLTYHS